jgi:hypothetical protein
MCAMSENAANVELFFPSVIANHCASEYAASGRGGGSAGKQPERRLRGQNQAGVQFPEPQQQIFIDWDWHQRDKSQGPRGTESPESFLLSDDPSVPFSARISVLSSDPCLRLQLLHEPIPLMGVAIIDGRDWYSCAIGPPFDRFHDRYNVCADATSRVCRWAVDSDESVCGDPKPEWKRKER